MPPKELQRIPEELFGALPPKVNEFSEYTQTRRWVDQWLKCFKEYCAVALSEEVTIEQFFDAPTVMTSWKL